MLVGRNVVGSPGAALALAVREYVLVRRNVVGILSTALALSVREGVIGCLSKDLLAVCVTYATGINHKSFLQVRRCVYNSTVAEEMILGLFFAAITAA